MILNVYSIRKTALLIFKMLLGLRYHAEEEIWGNLTIAMSKFGKFCMNHLKLRNYVAGEFLTNSIQNKNGIESIGVKNVFKVQSRMFANMHQKMKHRYIVWMGT